MASPQQRPDPGENRRIYENLERSRRERGTRAAGFAWWWVFWGLISGLAMWGGGGGGGGSGGWWWGGRARTGPGSGYTAPAGTNNAAPANGNYAGGANQAVTTGAGVAVLNATNKQSYVGKQFQVSDVPVQKKVNDHVLWIGARNATPMLLILSGNGNSAANAHIDKGSLISVTGTVQKAPPRSQAKSQWSLSGGGADRLEQQGAYIEATQVHAART
jgi:hypothetical protein